MLTLSVVFCPSLALGPRIEEAGLPCSFTLPNHCSPGAKLLEAGSQAVAYFDLELTILLPQPLECGNSKPESLDPAFFKYTIC